MNTTHPTVQRSRHAARPGLAVGAARALRAVLVPRTPRHRAMPALVPLTAVFPQRAPATQPMRHAAGSTLAGAR